MTRWWRDPWLWPVWLGGLFVAAAYGFLQAPAATAPFALLLLVGVYPVLEEIVFRGVIQPALLTLTKRRGLGPVTLANLLTSLLFAVFHLIHHPPLHAALVFVPSLAFGLFRDRSGSVLPGMVLHVSWNGAVLLAPLVAVAA